MPQGKIESKPVFGPTLDILLKGVAVFAPFVYAMGWGYTAGYWIGLGFVESMAVYTFQDYVFYGVLAIAGGAVEYVSPTHIALSGLIASAYGALIFATAWFFRWCIRRVIKKDLLIALRKSRRAKPIVEALGFVVAPGLVVAIFGVATLLVSAMLLLPIAFSAHQGETFAKKTQQKLITGKPADLDKFPISSFRLGDATVLQHGRLIACNLRWCAIAIGGNITAVPVDAVISTEASKPVQRR